MSTYHLLEGKKMIIKWYQDPSIQHQMLGMAMSNTNYMQQHQVNDLIGLFAVGRLVGTPGPINRNHQFVFKFDYTPLPSDWYSSMTFAESCLRTAEDLWRLADGRRLAIFWSGGIDSTAALVALMQTNPQWLQQTRIYTTDSAIEQEYPWFYHQYLRSADVLVLQGAEFFSADLFGPDILVTDGQCGDQLWGFRDLRSLSMSWHDPYPRLWDSQQFQNQVLAWQRDVVIDYIQQQIEKFPSPVRSIADLYWMLTFTHKWDHVRRRHMARVRDIGLFDDLHSFFNSFHLQRWAMSNLEPKIGDTWSSYKQPAKDFIYAWTRDQEYRINKTQVPSLPTFMDPKILRECNYFQLVTDQGYKTRDQLDNLVHQSFEWHWPP